MENNIKGIYGIPKIVQKVTKYRIKYPRGVGPGFWEQLRLSRLKRNRWKRKVD